MKQVFQKLATLKLAVLKTGALENWWAKKTGAVKLAQKISVTGCTLEASNCVRAGTKNWCV